MKILALFLVPLLVAVPATAAASATSVDAPGDILLFVLGVSGLLIGRKIARRRGRRD